MASDPPSLHQPGPLSLRRYGCLVILVVLVGLLIGAFLLIRHIAVGTAVPFRIVANIIQKANPNIKIEGISGDLSTGPSVKSITWGDDPANRSEILELRVKYNGWANAKATKRIVIEDVGVKKAHIDIADFGPVTQTTTTTSSSPGGRPYSSSSSSSSPVTDLGMDSVEVKQVLIEDVLITDRHSSFRLSIAKVSWTGFKMTKDTVEPGELVVESDRLTIHTVPGRTVPIGKETVTFQKTLNGTVQPLLHPAILQAINFTLDYSFVPEVKAPAFHFSTADGKVEIDTTEDGGRAYHVRHLDPAEFFDAHKLYGKEAADFPADLVIEATTAPEDGLLTIVSGSFRLGVTTFQIVPRENGEIEPGKAALRAVWRTGAGEIRWTLPLKDWPVECRPVFSSEPELAPTEILARVFAGKKYEELTPEEKQMVDARIPVYFSPALVP